MNSFDFKKQLLPHLIGIGILLVVGLAYFNPVLSGKTLQTHDIVQHKGMSKEVKDFKEETGETSLWTNSMFGGMPTYQIAPTYPNSLLLIKPIYKLMTRGLPKPLNMLILYFIGFYIMLIAFKVDWRLAVAGALAYGFASYNIIIIDAGHNTKALAIGMAPFVLAGINMALNHKNWILGAALAGVSMAFELKINHVQITYYLFFIIAGMGIAWLVRELLNGNSKAVLLRAPVLAIALLLGIGSNAGNMMVTAEYAKETTRGKSNIPNEKGELEKGLSKRYITDWSYGVGETGTLMIPNFKGGGAANNMDFSDYEFYDLVVRQYGKKDGQKVVQSQLYWGAQDRGTNGPVYLGALICFLFVFALFVLDKSTSIWIGVVSLLAIMLAWGRNFESFTNFFIDYFPGYNKFRTVTMILAIVQITFPLAGIFALSRVVKKEVTKEKVIKSLKWSLGIAGGFALLFALMPGMFMDFARASEFEQFTGQQAQILDMLIDARKGLVQKDAFRSLAFILIGGGAIFLLVTEKIKSNVFFLIIIGAVAIDMWPVAARFLGPDKFEKAKTAEPVIATKIDKQIMADPDKHYRVLNLTVSPFNDATTSYFHSSFGGYHGAKLKRIQELISNRVDYSEKGKNGKPKLAGEISDLRKNGFSDPSVSPVLNMFNVKYFIASTKQGKTLVPNSGAAGNAWFVNDVKVLDGAPEEMEALKGINPKQTATTTKEFEDYVSGFSGGPNGSINLVEYKPNYLKYEYDTDKDGFVVFSEVFYRGNIDWISTINGEEADHIRVNYHLRGMKVPQGKGTIEFKFDPPTYYTAETLSLISSILMVLMLLGGGFMAYRSKGAAEGKDA